MFVWSGDRVFLIYHQNQKAVITQKNYHSSFPVPSYRAQTKPTKKVFAAEYRECYSCIS